MSAGHPIEAPFTDEQVAALNDYQHAGWMHPFTCPADGTSGSTRHSDRRILLALNAGWICEHCGYTQSWAHAFMAEPRASDPTPEAEK